MAKLEEIKDYLGELKLSHIKKNIDQSIESAELNNLSFHDFLLDIFKIEVTGRNEMAKERRLKYAGFPVKKTMEEFDFNFQPSVTKRRVSTLLEFDWIDRMYNLIFLGPPGVGKTHLAISLGYKAAELGYKVTFDSMDNLIYVLKTKDISRKSSIRFNKISSANLVIIDELGYLPIIREEANLFFQLITALHEQASLIITSNKGFEDWNELLGDPALTTAILDRITYRCELFNMDGKSYRLENRKSLFEEK